ncbi:hypothetical protein, partial [Pontiella sp.]|uniref:hypothetical protein n=1 Tax=Pontiella sp. TaxID=2837462 RepID=UPI003569CCBE
AAALVAFVVGSKSVYAGASGATVADGKGGAGLYENGAMRADPVKQAYFDMMERFNYPIPDILKTDAFWVCDFDQGDILALGMGGIFWINEKGEYKSSGAGTYDGSYKDEQFGYLLHEIYLLPGQSLPEHRHLGGPEGHGPKMECWQVRYGEVYFHGEYRHGDEVPISEWPADRRPWGYGEDWFKSKYIVKRDAKTNQMYVLKDPESWHGQMAGPEGAIVTEAATYHNHVMFSKPGMAFKNSGAE